MWDTKCVTKCGMPNIELHDNLITILRFKMPQNQWNFVSKCEVLLSVTTIRTKCVTQCGMPNIKLHDNLITMLHNKMPQNQLDFVSKCEVLLSVATIRYQMWVLLNVGCHTLNVCVSKCGISTFAHIVSICVIFHI